MPVESARGLENEIISFLKGFSGSKTIEPDEFLSRDIGIYGGDGVQLLYELEEKFGVDLNPLIDAHTVLLPPNWFDRLRGRKHGSPVTDLTVRHLIDYIVGEHANRQK